jgi:hypothetical protein
MSTGARPAPARTLLRTSKRFGRDAARRRDEGSALRTAERAVSRSLGRLGHWGDARNPDGARRVARRGWVLALGGAAVAGAVAWALSGRVRRGAA